MIANVQATMRLVRLTLLLLLFAATAMSQELSTVLIPAVGNIDGPGCRWKTDVEIINDSAFEMDVAIELASAPTAPALVLSLAPGQVQRFTDVVGQAFGYDRVLSPLRITTADRRGVSIRAHAYAIQGTEISPLQPIDVFRADAWYPVRILDNLAFSEEFRTNIGLMNFGEQAADFLLALQRIPGRNVAIAQVRIEPGALAHMSIQSVFPLITEGHGFSVVIESGARDTYVYASVIQSSNNGASFISPRIGPR
jgi:hypothetical protein